MCSSVSSFSFCLHPKHAFLCRHRLNFRFSANPFFIRLRSTRTFCVTALIAEKNTTREFSWISSDEISSDDYNGWEIEEYPQKPMIRKSLSKFVTLGIGASVVGSLGLLVFFSLSRKGFGFGNRRPFEAIHGFKLPVLTSKNDMTNEVDGTLGDADVPEEFGDHAAAETMPSTVKEQVLNRIIVPFTVDYVQQEAFVALKKLKIIDDEVKADDLCTRREYARWLVRASSQLERSRKHQIIPCTALSGSRIIAFDDVSTEDPDFGYIQSLAETGIIKSCLSDGNDSSNLNNLENGGFVNFTPERFISRQDLISWKAKMEYEVMQRIGEEVSRKNIGYLDVKEISADSFVDLFVDFLANENSIHRGVFGQSKRLQPSRPCTKAQAAVALTCGRLSEFIQSEISKLEAENVSRQQEMKEAASELLERGEINQFWEREMDEEVSRGMGVERDYRASITALELEKNLRENSFADMLKQQAVLDCQKQLLSSLKAEVNDMSEKFSSERAKYMDELHTVHTAQRDLDMHYEELLDAKSILEAEVEALRILRSWIEEEARKSRERSKVLEEAGRRWKWDNQS